MTDRDPRLPPGWWLVPALIFGGFFWAVVASYLVFG